LFEFNVAYSILCFASATVAFTLGFFTLQYRRCTPYAQPLGFLLFASGMYASGYAFEIMRGDVAWFFLWLRVEYLGLSFLGGFFLWFALEFTEKLKKRLPLVLSVLGVSLFFLIAVWTNNYHHLYYSFIAVDYWGPFPAAHLGRGIFYILHSIWLFATFVWSGVLFLLHYRKVTPNTRKRALIPLIVAVLCVTVFALYLLRVISWSVDINPLLLTVNGVFFAVAITRMRFLHISPVARDQVFESMQDGVVITDLQDLVVDFNRAASQLIPDLSFRWLGKDFSTLLPELERYTQPRNPLEIESLALEGSNGAQHYEVRQIPVTNRKGKQIGTAWYFREVTERQRILHLLQDSADRDSLTGIHNRRKWVEMAEAELKRASRYRRPLALLFFDIDHFKAINDTNGHEVGDEVLMEVTRTVAKELRESDLLGRVGGDEFVVLLPETDAGEVLGIAHRLLEAISKHRMHFGKHLLQVTCSAGVVSWDGTEEVSLEELLRRADHALYQAKNSGRNRVVMYSPDPPPLR